MSVIVVSCVILQRRRKKHSIALTEERAVVHYPQATNNNYEGPVQLTTATTDPYHISHNEILDIRRQHEQKNTPAQVQPPSSQPSSPPVVPHQAPPTTPEASLTGTVTIQTVASEMSCVSEHDPLLPDNKDTPLTIPVFEESSLLMMKSSSHDIGGAVNSTINQDEGNGILLTSDVQEIPFTENTTEHDISYTQCKQMKGKYHLDDDSPFTESTITTHTGLYNNSGILMSDDITCYDERTTVSLESNNKLSNTSKAEKSTSHYVEVAVSTTHPKAPPTNDVPTQYVDICGHLNTMKTEDITEVPYIIRREHVVIYPMSKQLSLEKQDNPSMYEEITTLDENNRTIIPSPAQDEDSRSHLIVNVSPQRPQGMDCVHNTLVEIVSDYNHPSPNLSSGNGTHSSFTNNNIHPVNSKSDDEARLVTNTISYQEESVKPLYNFNAKSYYAISCSIPIPCCMIEDEPDLEFDLDDTSIPELVLLLYSSVMYLSNSSSVQVEEKSNDESSINKEVDSDNTETEINDNKFKCNFYIPLLL